jgi:hypothetical protein
MISTWSQKALQGLKHSTRVDLEGEHIDDLSRLGSPKLMRQLVLNYVQIPSIAGLKRQPQLETFIADSSQISSLTNFISIENVRKLSLRSTPVSRQPTVPLSVLLVCPNLVNLNGKLISSTLKQRAANYPPDGRKLVNAGWFAVFPYPSDAQLYQLSLQFGLASATTSVQEEEDQIDDEVDNFEENLSNLWKQHDRLIRTAKRQLGFEVPELSDEEIVVVEEEEEVSDKPSSQSESSKGASEDLLKRLAGVLKSHDVELDEAALSESVLDAVDKLCEDSVEQGTSGPVGE